MVDAVINFILNITVADVLSFANIVLAIMLTVYGLRLWKITPHNAGWRWLRLLYIIIGIYWGGLYFYVLFWPYPMDPVLFGQTFVRPAFTFTLAVMVAGSIQRYKSKTCRK